MKLSISNIAWDAKDDIQMYGLMEKYAFEGLEIAPTRIFPGNPYEKIGDAKRWAREIHDQYGLVISSMQSIWYGKQEKVFGTFSERQALIEYTKRAIDFAAEINCRNLIFGCPKNRNIADGCDQDIAIEFFRTIGDYAASKGTVIGMEANPPIYNTNFINDTASAIELIEEVGSEGFKLNLDMGTVVYNDEDISEITGKVHLINHVHISEPYLKPIEKRGMHAQLRDILMNGKYQGFVSVEMGKVEDISVIEESMQYVKEIFGDL